MSSSSSNRSSVQAAVSRESTPWISLCWARSDFIPMVCLQTEAYHPVQGQDSRVVPPLSLKAQGGEQGRSRRLCHGGVEEWLFENAVEAIRRNQHRRDNPEIGDRPSQVAL